MPSQMAEQLRLFISEDLSPEARSNALATYAEQDVASRIALGQLSREYTITVDNVLGASPQSVRPNGSIRYDFSYIGDVVQYALENLIKRSPASSVVSKAGPDYPEHYEEAFYVGINGRFIMATDFVADAVPYNAEIIIGNIMPYSRKVDVQMVGNKTLHFETPANLFDSSARAVVRRYGNIVTCKRIYTANFPGRQYKLKVEQRFKKRPAKIKRTVGTLVESPALVIGVR